MAVSSLQWTFRPWTNQLALSGDVAPAPVELRHTVCQTFEHKVIAHTATKRIPKSAPVSPINDTKYAKNLRVSDTVIGAEGQWASLARSSCVYKCDHKYMDKSHIV